MVLLSTYKLHLSPLISLQALCVLYMGQAFQIGCRVGWLVLVSITTRCNIIQYSLLLSMVYMLQTVSLPIIRSSKKQAWHIPDAVFTVFELLMMGGETA